MNGWEKENKNKLGEIVSKDTCVYLPMTTVSVVNKRIFVDVNTFITDDSKMITLANIEYQIRHHIECDEKDHLLIHVCENNSHYGIIYEVGNYINSSDWVIHGITKGYV